MSKSTLFKQIVQSLNPLAMASDDYHPVDLPGGHTAVGRALWNAGIAGMGALTLTALGKAITQKINARRWEDKSKKIVKGKVDALYPHYEEKEQEDTSLLSSLKALLKQANDPVVPRQETDVLKNTLLGTLPIVTTLTGLVGGPLLVANRLKDKDKEELDAQIKDKKDRLAQLRAQIVQAQLSKQANDPSPKEAAQGIANYILGTLAAAGTIGVFGVTSHFYNKRDKAKKIMDAAESLAERNLTNIPQRISLHLTSDNKPEISKKDKEWDRLTDEEPQQTLALNAPPINEDFSDKITKVEKDALFS